MKYQVELEWEQVDEIVRKEMMQIARDTVADPWPLDHSYESAFNLVAGCLHVFEHYSAREQLGELYTEDFLEKLQKLMFLAELEVQKNENNQNTES